MTTTTTNTIRIRKLQAAGCTLKEIGQVLDEQPTFYQGGRIYMNCLGYFYMAVAPERDFYNINALEAHYGLLDGLAMKRARA